MTPEPVQRFRVSITVKKESKLVPRENDMEKPAANTFRKLRSII
jgi:hypothetical protein